MSDIYYGSSVADATFTSGCDMGKNVATGGTETSKTSTVTGANNFAEIASQGGSIADVTAIPSTPTGKGWFYPLAAESIPGGLYTPVITLSFAGVASGLTLTVRAFYIPAGVLANAVLLGSGTASISVATKTVYSPTTFTPGSRATVVGDYLGFDAWYQDTGGASGDNPTVYESTNTSQGVVNEVQWTLPVFVPAVGAGLPLPLPITPGAVIGPSIWQGPPGLKYPSKMGPVIRRANNVFRNGGGLMGKNVLRRKWWQVL